MFYEIDSDASNSNQIRHERERARRLRKTQWWLQQINRGICHYCGRNVSPLQLTMDHIVPLARGGKSTRGNVVPACSECNRSKQLETPVETALRKLPLDKP